MRFPGARRRYPRIAALTLLAALAAGFSLFGIDAEPVEAHPGHPGSATDEPVQLWVENFENVASGDWQSIADYASTGGVTYSASIYWSWAVGCNGFVMREANPPTVAPGCPYYSSPGMGLATQWIAAIDGVAGGGLPVVGNHALAWYSDYEDAGHPLELGEVIVETEGGVPAGGPNRFLFLKIDAAGTNCLGATGPLLRAQLVDGGNTHTVIPAADVCAATDVVRDGQYNNPNSFHAGTFFPAEVPLVATSTPRIVIRNDRGDPSGNDGAIDNLQLFDASPQLDVQFGPWVPAGQSTTIRLTMTNTSDLLRKDGWNFNETLPAGMTVSGAVTNTCGTPGAINAPIGGTTISTASGALDTNVTSCYVEVPVTSAIATNYSVNASNVTAVGLKPPGSSSVTFTPTGGLNVTKSVDGTAPVASTFAVGVDCAGAAYDRTVSFDATGAVTSGNAMQSGIPAGTSCTVTETGVGGADAVAYSVNGGSGSAVAPAVSIVGGSTTTVAVTNTFNPPPTGSLDVSKFVSGTAPSGSTFGVAVDCTGTTFDRTVTFSETGALLSANSPIANIPSATSCSVTETNTGGATSVSYSVNGGGGTATAPNVPILAAQTATVQVTNTFTPPPPPAVGSLDVGKFVSGTAPSGSTFGVAVDCTGTTFDRTVTFSETGALLSANSPIANIPASTSCSVSETSTGGATSVSYSVNGGGGTATAPNVVIGDGVGSTVAVTNTFTPPPPPPPPATLDVTKLVNGTHVGISYVIEVNCDGSTFDRMLTFSPTGSLVSGTSPITGIPGGTSCSVTETGTGGAGSVAYSRNGGGTTTSPPSFSLTSGVTDSVVVINTFTPPPPPPGPGSLNVTTLVNGSHLGQNYTVAVNCDNNLFDRTLTFSPDGSLASGTSPITGIPDGTACTVFETNTGGAGSVGYSINGGGVVAGPANVTIASGQTDSVVVVNTFASPPIIDPLPIVDPTPTIVDPLPAPIDPVPADIAIAPADEEIAAPVEREEPGLEPLDEEIDEDQNGLVDIFDLLGDEIGEIDADGDGLPDLIAAGDEGGGHGEAGKLGNAFSGENASKTVFSGKVPSIWEVVKNPELMAAAVGMGMVWTLALVSATSALESAIGARIDDWSAFASKALPGGKALARLFAFLVSESWLAIGALMTINGLILSFVDPNFGFDWLSLRALASVLLASVLVVVVPLLIVRRFGERLWGTKVTFKTSPWGLIIGLLGVFVSRMIGFLPGLLGGSPLEVQLEDDSEADKARVTRTKLVLTLGLAFVFLGGASIVPDEGSWQTIFLHDALTAGAIVAIFGPFIDLLPVSIFAGSELWKHTRKSWFALMAVSSAAFAVVVLPDPSYWMFVGDSAKRWIMISTGVMVTALVAVIVVSKLETAEQRDEARAKFKKAMSRD